MMKSAGTGMALATAMFCFAVVAAPKGTETGWIVCEGEYPKHPQGVATDGTNIYWSFTTVLVKTGLDGRLVAKSEIPRGHMGDLCCLDGRVFVGMNHGKENGCRVGDETWEYDAATLELVRKHPTPEAVWCNNGLEFYDGYFWVITSAPRYCRYNMVFCYTRDFRFVRCQMIDSGWTNLGVQTICRHGDKMLFGCYGSREDPEQPHKGSTLVVDGKALSRAGSVKRYPVIAACERRIETSTADGMLVLDGRLMSAHAIRLSKSPQRWTARLTPFDLSLSGGTIGDARQ